MCPTAPIPFAGLDESRSAQLIRLREAVTPILANNLLPHFTDHSVVHSDNLVSLLRDLIAPLEGTTNVLSPDELVILYSACYLHDIGMQYEHIYELDVVPETERCLPWQELSDQSKHDVLRRYHHIASAKLVQLSASTTSAPIGLVLTQDYQPARVAALCEAHGLDTDSERYRALTAKGPNLRMELLSGLLRIADILDESRRRARRERARTLDLDSISQTHWWRHYYTENVTFDQQDKTICLHFDFPPNRLDEYARVVPELQLPCVKAELERHRTILGKNGLMWSVTHRVDHQPYSTTEAMPDSVMTSMLKELRRRRAQERDGQRAADRQAFDEAQPLLRRQRDDLEGQRQTLRPVDYLRRLHTCARDRWELGGTHAACMMLQPEFEQNASQLPPAECVTMAIELAGWLRMDGQSDAARQVLERLQGTVSELTAQDDLVFRYWCLLAWCANESAVHASGDVAIERAISSAKTTEQQMTLHAAHLEWLWLRGDLSQDSDDQSGSDMEAMQINGDAMDNRAESPNGFLGQVCPSVRITIERCRLAAQQGDADRALSLVETIRDAALPQLDRVAIDLCRAEILFLDGRADQTLQILDELAASLHSLPSGLEQAILDNRAMVRLAEFQADAEFYERYDRRRVHGIKFWNESAVLGGMINADKGRHYEAVPAFWVQVCHAHQNMSWQGQRWAHTLLARELLNIGFLIEAAWHATLALDTTTAQQIGAALRSAGDSDSVRVVVDRLLQHACPPRHAQIACVIFGELMDLLPEDQVDRVSAFIAPLAAKQEGDRGLSDRLAAAWKAIVALIPCLDDETRGHLIRLAIDNNAWHNPVPLRRHLIRFAIHACDDGIPDAVRRDLVEAALSLVTITKSDIDYSDALNLVCQLAQHGPSKDRIGATLFPADGASGNALLGQIAPLFGKHVTDLDAIVKEAIRQIRLQMQHLAADQEPEKLGFFTMQSTRGDQKVATCIGAGIQLLAVVQNHKDRLSSSSLIDLVDAILVMMVESDNDMSNRVSLVDALAELADRMDESTVRRVAAALQPLAEGEVVESTVLMPSEATQHPLSRVSISTSTRGQLRGHSILALSGIAKHDPGIVDEVLDPLMSAALTDLDPDVRTLAYAAARRVPMLSTGVLSAVLVGTQDPDSTVARVSWIVLAESKSPTIPTELWDTVVFVLRKALRHRHSTVRQAAASAAGNLLVSAADVPLVARHMEDVVAEFRRDPCYSVRSQAWSKPVVP